MAKALPASERGRKQALLERATTLLRDRLQQANAARRLRLVSAIAEQWLDMGERDRARLVLQEAGRFRSTSTSPVFWANWRGSSPIRPWHGCRSYRSPTAIPVYRDHELAAVAVELAIDHPAEAEQVFNLREGSDDPGLRQLLRTATMSSSGPSRSAACPSRRRVAERSRDTRLRLGIRGPRPGGKGQGRCIRGDRSRDPGNRSAAGIGTGSRTDHHR